jgi:protein arginine kinase
VTYESIIRTIPSWLNGRGPESAIVISSRARLARNIRGISFAHRAGQEALDEVMQRVTDAASLAGFDSGNLFANKEMKVLQKQVFIERRLITSALAAKNGSQGVLVADGEERSVLVNEEDHLRLQSFRSGFDPHGALSMVEDIDDHLSQAVEYAFSDRYGYLTACPTNMGTGLRASVLIHLPALVMTGEIQRMVRSAAQLGLAVRGYYGEGSEVVGNLFQISNQRAMGRSEKDIVESLVTVVSRIVEYEKQAASTLLQEARSQTEDKIWRSIGILKTARVLSTIEFMSLSSAVRLGILLECLDAGMIPLLNELMVLMQPAHLQELTGAGESSPERDVIRAGYIRERFVDVRL